MSHLSLPSNFGNDSIRPNRHRRAYHDQHSGLVEPFESIQRNDELALGDPQELVRLPTIVRSFHKKCRPYRALVTF